MHTCIHIRSHTHTHVLTNTHTLTQTCAHTRTHMRNRLSVSYTNNAVTGHTTQCIFLDSSLICLSLCVPATLLPVMVFRNNYTFIN